MPAFAQIAAKDLRLLARDRVALFWVVGFPLAFAALFGSVMKAGVDAESAPIPIIIVAEPHASAQRPLVDALRRAGLHVQTAPASDARAAVRRGEAVAFLRIQARAGAPRVELGIDPSRRSEGALLRSLVASALQPAPARMPAPRIDSVDIVRERNGPRNGFEIVFPAMVLWGLLGCAATFAIGVVVERTSGTLLRLYAAPIARSSVLAGKAAACLVACLLDTLLLSVIGRFALGVRFADPLKYAAAIAATAACFVGLTMALSMLGKSEQAVAGAGWATLIVMAMLGGAMVPLSIMPSWLLTLSDFSPVKWGIFALEGATWRAFAWHELTGPLLRLVAFGVAAFGCGVAFLVSSRQV